MSVAGMFAMAAGLVALCATVLVFGGVTEDVTRHDGLSTTDPTHLRWFTDHRPHALVSVARVVTELGSPLALALVTLSVAGVLWIRGRRLLLVLAPGVALALGALCAAIGKAIVARSRPPVPLHLVAESGASFPSGHATDATAVYLTIAFVVAAFVLRRPIARAMFLFGSSLLAAAIGMSRLVLGVHWPTDVLAGWALGAGAAITVTLVAAVVTRTMPDGPASNRPLARVARVVMTLERQSRSLEAV